MIVTETYKTREDGVKLVKTYSNENVMIKRVGTTEIYACAIDVEGTANEYTETDIAIVEIPDEAEAE